MNTEETRYKDLLRSALQAAVPRAWFDISNSARDGRAQWALISEATISPVEGVLRSVPKLSELEGQVCAYPGGSSSINLSGMARFLVFHSCFLEIECIVNDAFRLFSERRYTVWEVRLIEGFDIEEVVELGLDFFLFPLSELGRVEHPSELLSPHNTPRHGWGTAPKSAIVRIRKLPLELHPQPGGEDGIPSCGRETTNEEWQAVLDSILLSSNGAVQTRQGYSVKTDPGWFTAGCSGWGSSESFPRPVKHVTGFSVDLARKLLPLLLGIDPRMNLALKRLESSRRRHQVEDRAIDLGICAEILLMGSSNDNTEISYKIATRAAWLINGGPEARVQIFDKIRALYSRRSASVHTGTFRKRKERFDAVKQDAEIDEYDNIVCQVAIELLERRPLEETDWKGIVLGLPSKPLDPPPHTP